MEDDRIRFSHEGLMDLQRAIMEATKQSLHQQVEEQQQIINTLNRTASTQILGEIKAKIEEGNTALRILATQTNKLIDAINRQTEILSTHMENIKKIDMD